MSRPPRIAEALLRLSVPREDREAVLGDMAEEYARFVRPRWSPGRARFWYWRLALASIVWRFFSGLRQTAEALRRRREGDGLMEGFLVQLKYAWRAVWKNPGASSVVALTLALGIGANVLVFSVVDNLVLNPFSFPDGDRLIGVGPAFPKLDQELEFIECLSPAEYQDIAKSSSLQKVVAWDMGNRQVSGTERPENLFSAFWWGDAFETLGVKPEVGRGFTLEETTGQAKLAIISHRFWLRRFGGDPGVVGQVVKVNDEPYTLVGVMPASTLLYGTDLWLPMGVSPERFPRGRRQFQVLARLAPGVDLRHANAELEIISRQVEARFANELPEYLDWHLRAETWTDINTRTLRPAALVLAGAVGFVLLLVCANVASFHLARSMARRREMAIRVAMGANRSGIVSQLLIESLTLSLLGGATGLAACLVGVRSLNSLIASNPIPFVDAKITINPRVLLFTAAVSIFSGILFGLAPAWNASRSDIHSTLKNETGGATPTAGKLRFQSLLVAFEVCLAFVLLAGAGLLLNSFIRVQSIDPGFKPENLLTMRLTLPRQKYQGAQVTQFFQNLVEQVESIPGVLSAAAVSQFPPRAFFSRPIRILGREIKPDSQLPSPYLTIASEGTFKTVGVRLLKGRLFNSTDRAGTPLAAVVNEAAARRYFPGEDPIGQRFTTGSAEESDAPVFEIVGIVSSTQNRGLESPPQPEIFGAVRQLDGWWNQLFLMIRTAVPPRGVIDAVREKVAALDPDQPVYLIQTVEEAFDASTSRRRYATMALAVFALFALGLASVGIFAVISYKVVARTREIGVRMALGAEASRVRAMVIRQSLKPVLIGAAVGFVVSQVIGGLVRNVLFQVNESDPLTISLAVAVLGFAALAASYLPARRASRMDPVKALRYE